MHLVRNTVCNKTILAFRHYAVTSSTFHACMDDSDDWLTGMYRVGACMFSINDVCYYYSYCTLVILPREKCHLYM